MNLKKNIHVLFNLKKKMDQAESIKKQAVSKGRWTKSQKGSVPHRAAEGMERPSSIQHLLRVIQGTVIVAAGEWDICYKPESAKSLDANLDHFAD